MSEWVHREAGAGEQERPKERAQSGMQRRAGKGRSCCWLSRKGEDKGAEDLGWWRELTLLITIGVITLRTNTLITNGRNVLLCACPGSEEQRDEGFCVGSPQQLQGSNVHGVKAAKVASQEEIELWYHRINQKENVLWGSVCSQGHFKGSYLIASSHHL